jgi:hypothetical protein
VRIPVSVLIAAVFLLSGCARPGSDAKPVDPRAGKEPAVSPSLGQRAVSGTCAYGPWAEHCPEAEWARRVVEAAGYRLTGDTGSALVGRAGDTSFYFWAFEAEKAAEQPLRKTLADEGYELIQEIDEIDVFSDGIRLAWEIQSLYVWLEGGPTDSLEDIEKEAIRTIVRASAHVRYP